MQSGHVCKDFIIKSDSLQNTIISGYASVFNMVDSQEDLVEKGAFENAKREGVKLLWQHDSSTPIGVIKSLYEDDYGLKIDAEINNKTTAGREASELIKQGAVEGLSIGFCPIDFTYNCKNIRVLKKVDLMEISIVTFPSNNKAGIRVIKGSHSPRDGSAFNRLQKLLEKLISNQNKR